VYQFQRQSRSKNDWALQVTSGKGTHAMSETDKYLEAWLAAREFWWDGEDDKAAAYLREHFVTRERYEESQDAIGRYLGQLATLTAERDMLQDTLEKIATTYYPTHEEAIYAAQWALNPEDCGNG